MVLWSGERREEKKGERRRRAVCAFRDRVGEEEGPDLKGCDWGFEIAGRGM